MKEKKEKPQDRRYEQWDRSEKRMRIAWSVYVSFCAIGIGAAYLFRMYGMDPFIFYLRRSGSLRERSWLPLILACVGAGIARLALKWVWRILNLEEKDEEKTD